ncbi:energy transducer TonB [Luteibaculum oceani]|uniref:Energy transducer TonB n=1 Tax=Luteibaculum oceani TaxID=1294296 RepID=A0A5C6VIA8_9FLAO|nr:energy transducer TonB [Luteibaculum oceani]TXC85053.1 energy transducer TonB [Luteibaculum oceani]
MELKKNPEANLENKRSGFLFVGLVFALALVLLAFEYTTYDKEISSLGELQLDLIEEEIVPIAQVQPPPPPPPPQPTTVIEIVDDEEDVEEELEVMDLEVDEDTDVEIVEMPAEEVEEEEIFTIVEQMPQFPGGDAELFKYLGKNIKYPTMAQDAGIQGVVFVTFVVEKDGSVSDARVLRGIGGGCDEEALRVVRSMPKWTPGEQRGKKVKVQYNLPVRFTLR